MSNYAMDGCDLSPKARNKHPNHSPKKELSCSIGSPSGHRRRQVDRLTRENRRTTFDKLSKEAGLSCAK